MQSRLANPACSGIETLGHSVATYVASLTSSINFGDVFCLASRVAEIHLNMHVHANKLPQPLNCQIYSGPMGTLVHIDNGRS